MADETMLEEQLSELAEAGGRMVTPLSAAAVRARGEQRTRRRRTAVAAGGVLLAAGVVLGGLGLTGTTGEPKEVATRPGPVPAVTTSAPEPSRSAITPEESRTGSTGVSPSAASSKSATASATTRESPSSRSSVSASAPAGDPRWAGTQQFVQVKDAWTSNGRIYVSVRPAEKKVNEQFDTWTVEPGTGSYVTVALTPDARTILCAPLGDERQPADYPQTQLISRLKTISSSEREGLGYNLTFDAQGQVTLLEQVYRA
ncbi:hypothetical protein ACIBL6_14725 [Streptomyces sp. NPDC050400]|uniref:hypothetical protein n=1 Tax=Streptomyces sp. NPDC050400 TaxID=3365610 RepID=UPI0037969164